MYKKHGHIRERNEKNKKTKTEYLGNEKESKNTSEMKKYPAWN